MLEEESMGRLLVRLSIPAIAAMMIHSLYHIVDTIFIGKGVGAYGIAAVFTVLPLTIFVFALASMIGAGGASILSRSLGSGNSEKAAHTIGNVLFFSLAVGVAFMIVGYLFGDALIRLFGGGEKILPYAREYFFVVILEFPLMCFSVGAENIIRAMGKAKTAMVAMIVSSIVNVLLDWIFIFGLDMGMFGAALATVIAQLSMAVYFLCCFLKYRKIMSLGLSVFRPLTGIMRDVVLVGLPNFIRPASGSIVVVIINNTLTFYGGEIAVASYGIINRAVMFSVMPLFGIAQGMQPALGFNYGAQRYDRALQAIKLSLLGSTALSTFAFVLFLVFPVPIVSIFTSETALVAQTAPSMRLVTAAFFMVGVNVVVSAFFQAMGHAGPSLFLTLSRQVIFLIPLLLFLPRFLDSAGVWLSFPIADLMAGILSLSLLLPMLRRLRA